MVPLLNMQQGRRQQEVMAKVSISILVMALPVLYVSFLQVPPAKLFRDTTFWFLMSNSIIVAIAADSGVLGSSCSVDHIGDDRPFVGVDGNELSLPVITVDQASPFVVHGDDDDDDAVGGMKSHGDASIIAGAGRQGVPESSQTAVTSRVLTARKRVAREERRRRSRSHSHGLADVPADPVQEKSMVVVEEKLRRTATEGRNPRSEAAAAEERESEYARLSDEELNRRVEDFITRFNREIRLQVEKEQA